MFNYKNIFERIERTIKNQCSFTEIEFEKQFGLFKHFEVKKRTDNEFFEMLTMIIFYSGFRASTVENKKQTILRHFPNYEVVSNYSKVELQNILADTQMIRNERKIQSCIANAKVFNEVIKTYGSFQNYLENFEANNSFENLILLKEELEYRFSYLGGTTAYHFLTDLGFNVLKPDRVILRIFKRLELIENEKQLLKAVIQGRKFAEATGLPIRYIDIVLVKYGQEGESKKFGLKNGICLEKNPNCEVCSLVDCCKYFLKVN